MNRENEQVNQKHKEDMQAIKEKVDEKIRSAKDKKGLLLVLTGDGKGKSTSAFGTVARAVGHKKSAAVVQFIKGKWHCGERELLEQHGVEFAVMATGFTWNTQDREGDIQAATEVWEKAKVFLRDETIDVVLLDELTYMINYEYLPREEVLNAIKERPAMQHVIVTGRDCCQELIELADTVSEVKSICHAFDAGIKAQKGIDY